MLAGAGSFDGGVQREQVGLEGDLVNNLDNFTDVLPSFVDFRHRRDHGAHLLATLGGCQAGGFGQLIGLVCVLCTLHRLCSHFGH